MPSNLDRFSELWSTRKQDYVLLTADIESGLDIRNCLIFNTSDRSKLIIEDDALAQVVMEKMKNAGVRIVTRDELGPESNRLEDLINRMIREGQSPQEINSAINDHK